MHDDYIISYSVNFRDKTIIFYTYNEDKMTERKLEILDVLTHSFSGALEQNQILDIDDCKIDDFIKDNNELLKNMKNYCWPIDYQNIQELEDFLVNTDYKYIKILSSYGMSGWVLAKSFKIK